MEQIGKAGDAVENAIQSFLLDSEEKYSVLQLFFLRRLNRLLQLRQQQAGQLNTEGTLLLDRAIFSTYCDAVDLGVGTEAHKIIAHLSVASHERPEN
jgi:hypothetical protein